MRTSNAARALPDDDVFSVEEIARAAGVPAAHVTPLLPSDRRVRFVARKDAIRLVRTLAPRRKDPDSRSPLSLIVETRRAQSLPLTLSGAGHLAALLVILLISSGWLDPSGTEQPIVEPTPVRLVFLMTPGPGGGGGGGGMKTPIPPSRARRSTPKPTAAKTPVPPARKAPPPPVKEPPKPPEPPTIDPPRPEPPRVEPPNVEPPNVDPPAPRQTVQAPVAPAAPDTLARAGVLDAPPSVAPSPGPGVGGSAGTGSGTGIGEGRGGGVGPGEGGGIGGGPFQPGAGIAPPSLLREVKPIYTDEARKRSLEGDVVLEVVVRRDGTVGNVRVVRRLGSGLDERAVEAVRQWRFAPARRLGSPVDVVVEISVEFSLR